MDFIVIIFVIITVISSIASSAAKKTAETKKREEEQKRRVAQGGFEQRPPQQSASARRPIPGAAPSKPRPVQHAQGSTMAQPPKAHNGSGLEPTLSHRMDTGSPNPFPQGHVVGASFDTNHAHMETSMNKDEGACPPSPSVLNKKPTQSGDFAQPSPALQLFSSSEDIIRGVIYSEILSKPKTLRRIS